MAHKPRILFFDIESAGVNALKSDLGFVIIFGYKWSHQKKAKILVIDKKGLSKFDDSVLLRKASKLMTRADLLVAHFGSVFDRRFVQGRLLINKLPPIPNTKMRDTCMIARSVANFGSNRLKSLAKTLHLKHHKMESEFPGWWFAIMRQDRKALRLTAEYCRRDVEVLEELYYRLRPFDNAHPRVIRDRARCAVCGGEVKYWGFTIANQLTYRRFRCMRCSRWDRERKAYKGEG